MPSEDPHPELTRLATPASPPVWTKSLEVQALELVADRMDEHTTAINQLRADLAHHIGIARLRTGHSPPEEDSSESKKERRRWSAWLRKRFDGAISFIKKPVDDFLSNGTNRTFAIGMLFVLIVYGPDGVRTVIEKLIPALLGGVHP